EAETITLPSAGGPASTTAYDDAEHIQRQYLEPLISSKRNVILLMHSYAGVPGTESDKGFARKDLAAQGKKGGVVGLVYLSSFIVP
ncbi:alpha/beta fold hydrolase, partial [Nocardioides malaquae]|uniref:alpha/beta fold hydrolase n=1 Tax=Nocardioides malaquae TaxID=2773426 RepID=UPI001D0D48A8